MNSHPKSFEKQGNLFPIRKYSRILTLTGLLFLVMIAASCTGMPDRNKTGVFDLTCERLTEPVGIEQTFPRFSWKLSHPVREQSAYRVLVSTTEKDLKDDNGTLWDSERVSSGQSHLVQYQGKPLSSYQQAFWKVKAWDENGNDLGWSDPSVFRMGILEPEEWHASWIQGTMPVVNNPETDYWFDMATLQRDQPVKAFEDYKRNLLEQSGGNIILARSFNLEKVPSGALMYSSAQGFYTVYINGERVGDRLYEPAIGYINSPVYYDVQDVTPHLKKGTNIIKVSLTRGRHTLSTSNKWEAIVEKDRDPSFIMQIVSAGQDNKVIVQTDDSWKQANGPIIKGFFYLGELYDGRVDHIRDDIPADDQEWQPVKVIDVKRGLKWRSFPPERIIRKVIPKKVFSPATGVWVFDLGEMITGTISWKEPAGMSPGDRVLFRYTQRTNATGWKVNGPRIPYPDGMQVTDSEGMIFRTSALGVIFRPREFIKKYPAYGDSLRGWNNIQSAVPADVYLCAGDPGEEWTGTERIHAFRYIEVIGLKEPPQPEDLTAHFIHTDLKHTGLFTCSDQTLQRFYDMSLKVELMNDHGISADCWDREKWSWNGETVGKAGMALYNLDISHLYNKLTLENALIARDSEGRPTTNTLERRDAPETPLWEQSLVQLPWFVYQYTGDIQSAEENYDALMNFLKHYFQDTERTTIWESRWGDHLWAAYRGLGNKSESRRNKVLGTATLFDCTEKVKQIAGILGKDDDIIWLSDLQDRIRTEIKQQFYDETLKTYGNDPVNKGYGGDCENSVVAHSGLLNTDERAEIIQTITSEIRQRDYALISGTQTMWRTLDLLAEFDFEEEAYRALSRDGYPGLKHAMELCPDGIPERFYARDPSKNASISHATFCQISRYFHFGLGGLRPDFEQPGFKHFTLAPQIPADLEAAAIEHESPYGTIFSGWEQSEGKINYSVVIPPNSTAAVQLPHTGKGTIMVKQDQKPVSINWTLIDRQKVQCLLEPGTYEMEWTRIK